MNKKAFTLLELLMVVIIIGIIATFAIPEYAKFKEKVTAVEAIRLMSAKMREIQLVYKTSGSIDDYDTKIEPASGWLYKDVGGVSGLGSTYI